MKSYSKGLTFFAKLLVSLSLLTYLFYHTNFASLWQALSKIKVFYFVSAFFLYISFQMISTLRWQLLCKNLGFQGNYKYFLRLYFINQYFNVFLPGLLGGDIIRVGYLLKDGASKSTATLSVFYDRAFGFFGALALIFIFIPFSDPFLDPKSKKILWTISGIVLFIVGILIFIKKWRPKWLNKGFFLLASTVFYPKNFSQLFLLGLLVQTFYSLHLYVLSQGISLSIPIIKFFIMVPVMGIVAALPISLGGLGIREGTLVYFLKQLGYGPEYGLALGLLVYIIALLGGLIGGILYLFHYKNKILAKQKN